jgi:hypothetical protein
MASKIWDMNNYHKHITGKISEFAKQKNLSESQARALKEVFNSAFSITSSYIPFQIQLLTLWAFLVGGMMTSVYISRFPELTTLLLSDFYQFCLEEMYMGPEKAEE